MADKVIDKNAVSIVGEITSGFEFSHKLSGEGFYLTYITVNRLNDLVVDIIPVMVSERLVDVINTCIGRFVEISGQFRSHNKYENGKNRLKLFVFAKEWDFVEEINDLIQANQIFLHGYICKTPAYRKTPLGREITELLIAVDRVYKKTDCIPCIAWGRNARFATEFVQGGEIQIWGRVQSREYQKKLSEEEIEKHIAYEVSIGKLDYLNAPLAVYNY